MQIEDILLAITEEISKKAIKGVKTIAGAYYGVIGKIPRMPLTDRIKHEIAEHGLYHFCSEKTAEAIMNSEHLKPGTVSSSYGKKCAFMFNGPPSVDNFAKNMATMEAYRGSRIVESQVNPYLTPTKVATAVKFTPQLKDLDDYKFRGFQDGAIMYEGYCILPHNEAQIVKMVADLKRDKNGNPLFGPNNEYQLVMREAVPEELTPDKQDYIAKQDYLQFITKKALEYGYRRHSEKERTLLGKKIAAELDVTRMEIDVSRNTINSNGRDIRQMIASRLEGIFSGNKKLDRSAEEILGDFNFRRANPYQDKAFALKVAEIQREEGISQLKLEDALEDFTNSDTATFLEKRSAQLEGKITRKGIHGREHSNRVALLAALIGYREGLFKSDKDNRIKDILITSAQFHDIGRILDFGPHGRRSAKKISQMELLYANGSPYTEEDRKMVMALADAHEGTPEKIEEMIKRYGITSEEDINVIRRLNTVLRDADALDRGRADIKTTIGYRVNLDPSRLENKTSKGLINAAYQLQFLTKRKLTMSKILSYKRRQEDESQIGGTLREKVKVPAADGPDNSGKTRIDGPSSRGNLKNEDDQLTL